MAGSSLKPPGQCRACQWCPVNVLKESGEGPITVFLSHPQSSSWKHSPPSLPRAISGPSLYVSGPSLYVCANHSAVWSTRPGVEHLPWFSGFRKEADWVLISIGLLRGVVSFSFPSLYLPFCSGLANISESGTHSCARKLEVSTSGKLTQLPASFSPGPEQDLGSGRRWPCYPGCSQPVGFSASNLCLGRY